jgi:hypothetical protein
MYHDYDLLISLTQNIYTIRQYPVLSIQYYFERKILFYVYLASITVSITIKLDARIIIVKNSNKVVNCLELYFTKNKLSLSKVFITCLKFFP